jgi:peptidylprolyl isomerase
MNRTHWLRLVAGAVAIVLLTGACGQDEVDEDTTTTVVAADADNGGAGDAGSSEAAAAIEERGAPTIDPVEGAVEELQLIDEVEGTGEEVQPGDTVTAHYVGALAENGEVFDSSWTRGAPATFPLDGVIQGWAEGVPGMKEGGRRTLVIPGDLAYGSSPPPGSGIPADAAMVFTIDLVSVQR